MTEPDQGDLLLSARKRVFATTHWSVVLGAGERHSSRGTEALEKLCRTYWFPLFSFIRRQGLTAEDAKDLTQQFFTQLLERKDLETVDARKGKFRTFLLASLSHFLSNQRDHARAAKRGGGWTLVPLDAITTEKLRGLEPVSDLSPDKLFDQRWAIALLEHAVVQLRSEMVAAGKAAQFEHLKSFLTNEPREGEYAAAAEHLGGTSQTVAVSVHRLRQRFRELVRLEVAHTVASPMDVTEEMRHLYAALHP